MLSQQQLKKVHMIISNKISDRQKNIWIRVNKKEGAETPYWKRYSKTMQLELRFLIQFDN